jgi:predicted dehydrogenase
MVECLGRHNPGPLLHAHLEFESLPVAEDPAAWRRQEREARTLLMDYSIHFLDLACLFDEGEWRVDAVRHELDPDGRTALVDGRLVSERYAVTFLLRQGFGRRTASLLFTFQNYSVRLGFFPDTFALRMADDNPMLHLQEAAASLRAIAAKAWDRLLGKESDLSHALVFAAALGGAEDLTTVLGVGRLAPFYRVMLHLADLIYAPDRKDLPG